MRVAPFGLRRATGLISAKTDTRLFNLPLQKSWHKTGNLAVTMSWPLPDKIEHGNVVLKSRLVAYLPISSGLI